MDSTQITIAANGKNFTVPEGSTLSEFTKSLDLSLDHLVVERNRTALTPSEARQTILEDGDQIELVRIVAGG